MIREGDATLVAEPADVIDLLDPARSRGIRPVPATAGDLDRDLLGPRERTVLDALPSRGPVVLDRLVCSAGLAGADILPALGILEAAGWVISTPDGWRLARR